jgi:hypothetical protein
LARFIGRISMNYDYGDIEFAMCAIRVLAIVAVVAVVSYAFGSRAMFLAGSLGSLLGYVAPHGREYASGMLEAIFISQLQWTAGHILGYGVFGAFVACAAVAGLRAIPRSKARYSLRALLITMTVIAAIAALVRLMSE